MEESFNKLINGGYCIGCGSCSAINKSPVSLRWNNYGQIQAISHRDITQEEDKEIQAICPFLSEYDESMIGQDLYEPGATHYETGIGFYISLHAGYVKVCCSYIDSIKQEQLQFDTSFW